MQPDPNPAAQIRPAVKRCPDCGEPKPTSAFYDRGDGYQSTYCKHHQRERSRASYRRRRQNPDELARMRSVERARKAASRARLRTVDPGRETRLAKSRSAAARRLIAAHLDEYRVLLELERQQHDSEGGPGVVPMRPDLQKPPAVPDTLTPGDQLLAAGLGVGAAASGLVWASGQLAGLAFGRTWLELDPAEVASVLWQLRHHLDDPALAWPTSAQQVLPGPAGMYASFVATTAGAVGAAGGVMRLRQWAGLGNPNAPDARVKRPAAGSATWASPRELRPLRVRQPEPGRVILGRIGGAFGRLLAGEDCHSVLVFGPPGSFKTAGVVIPAILEWSGPVLATSVKPDVIKATRAHREHRGEVVVLDPLGSSGLAGAQWTPLAFCGTWAGAQQMAATIAHTADLGTLATAEHKYWKTLGQKLLAPLLFAAARDGRSMVEVLRWVDLREDSEVAKLLADSDVDGAITAWEASQSRTDKARDSVYGTAEDLLAIYADERVQRFTSGHDLAEDAFLQGDNTLYLYAPVHEQRRLRPLFETVAMQLVQTAQEQAARAPDGMLDPRLLCALDEAGNVAALELLPEWATTGRGQGIQLLSVWHDQAQLVHRYGDRAATILNGHRAKVFLSGLADVGALELGSKLIGDQAVTETNYSTDPGGRVAASQATSYRPLVPLEELRRLQPGEGIVVYGHLRPARIQVRPPLHPAGAALAATPGAAGHPPPRAPGPNGRPRPRTGRTT